MFASYRAAKRREKLPLLLKNYIEQHPDEPENLDDFFDNDNFVPAELLPLLGKD